MENINHPTALADEPTLPFLPPPTRFAVPPKNAGRKRIRGLKPPAYSLSSSSDPAVFSSDDDPALDNYIHGRRKKRYVGTWYDQHPASSDSADSAMGDDMRPPLLKPRPQRQFKRQFDSGVWMQADISTDADENMELDPSISRLPISHSAPLRPRYSEEEASAQQIVQSCIDVGREEVDLSALQLCSIPNAILELISLIVPIPTVAKDVAFEQRDPDIKLFLSNNFLRQFPSAIINIEHLTVLSLRGNRLTELPPAIASLKNLETLNIAQNKLRSLPGELLSLMKAGSKLTDVQLHPNPFYQPRVPNYCPSGMEEYERGTFGPKGDADMCESWHGFTTTLLARTPVQFSYHSTVVSRFEFPTATSLPAHLRKLDLEELWFLEIPKVIRKTIGPLLDEPRASTPKGAPPLFEMALRAAARYPDRESTKCMLGERGVPRHFTPAFERAAHIFDMGSQTCCVCGRDTIMPLTEWVEFREVQRTHVVVMGQTENWYSTRVSNNGDEHCVPFVRKGCSWSCIPFKASEPSEDLELVPEV
ncbi:hypothetical protein B0H67DRAFT_503119 [Lasiosphaeris hirsuta]|uniref:Leucine rich repeat domain-containing protein n=1 Tax=Lasiosphaeris hirsuta TaxID=260670 RepID=A0AA40EAF4_9PEZI|nr:hypothetical protein B0H67DRAFT_503119 [Lasiosphaeris hirsuta]